MKLGFRCARTMVFGLILHVAGSGLAATEGMCIRIL